MNSTSTYPNQNRITGSLIRFLPFLILSIGAVILAFKWNSIPEHWAVHWGLNGKPDRWVTKTISAVFLPIGAGLLLWLFLETVTWSIRSTARRRRRDQLAPETAIA